jgi:hypothetical protein
MNKHDEKRNKPYEMRAVTVESDFKSKNWNMNNKGDEKTWYTNAIINKI